MVFCSCSVEADRDRAHPRLSRAFAGFAGPPGGFVWAVRRELSLRNLRLNECAGLVCSWTRSSLPWVDRYFMLWSMNVDVYFTVGVHAASEKEVESKDCKQDNDDDGNRSNATGRIF